MASSCCQGPPAAGGIFAGLLRGGVPRPLEYLPVNTWTCRTWRPPTNAGPIIRPPVRERGAGRHPGQDGHARHRSLQPTHDRRLPDLRSELRRPHRRGARLQHRAHAGADRHRHEHGYRRRASVRHRSLRRAPTNLPAATPVSQTQINLSWTASTHPSGVPLYRVERCQGAATILARSGPLRPTPSTTRVSSPRRRTDIEFEPRMEPPPRT